VPSDRTMVTELGTALGMLGDSTVDDALRSRSSVMHSLSPERWAELERLRRGKAFDGDFHAAWENGRAFLAASDGLRGRLPRVVEWKGTLRAPGDEVAPIDLRVDHVYLVSCKYLSDILFNVSPSHVFDNLLVGSGGRGGRGGRTAARQGARSDNPEETGRSGGDWFAEVAPVEYQTLYDEVRAAVDALGSRGSSSAAPRGRTAGSGDRRERSGSGPPVLPGLDDTHWPDVPGGPERSAGLQELTTASQRAIEDGSAAGGPGTALRGLPARVVDLTVEQRDALADWLKGGWPGEAKKAYQALSDRVSRMSVHRWELAMDRHGGTGEAMLWRLLRMGSAPYFVLGSSATRSLRLRIATPWDWRQHFTLGAVFMTEQRGGQPRVGWEAVVRDRATFEVHELAGHIEVRWSHGRFGGPPEAKGYLDTPHHLVPGYFPLR
jgi:hypothetical protein